MQENKKKKGSGMWIFLLILVLAISYFVYDTYFKDDTKQNQMIVNSDIEVGTVYEYSEEEIQDFISKAEQELELDKRYGLKPGYDIDTWKDLTKSFQKIFSSRHNQQNDYYLLW